MGAREDAFSTDPSTADEAVASDLLAPEIRRLLEVVEARVRAEERARILPGALFLSPVELEELTGYQRAGSQVEWLRTRHWPFEIAAGGRARVLRDAVIARLGGAANAAQAPQSSRQPKLRLPT
jgi:hypothetical protein